MKYYLKPKYCSCFGAIPHFSTVNRSRLDSGTAGILVYWLNGWDNSLDLYMYVWKLKNKILNTRCKDNRSQSD